MSRFLAAHLPFFRLERCGHGADAPVALIAEQKSALRVLVATPPALAQGVAVGMTLAAAKARCPTLATELLDAEGEAVDLQALAERLSLLSPLLAALPPEGLTVELGGDANPVAERAALRRARQRLEGLGHRVQIVIADDPTTAHLLARWGPADALLPPGGAAEALAPLPLAALGLPLEDLALLGGLGLRTAGELAGLPLSSVIGRLSPAGVAAHRRARGRINPLPLAAPAGAVELCLRLDLDDPIEEAEPLLFLLRGLLGDLAERLALRGAAATALTVSLHLESGATQELRLRLGAPTRDPNRMLPLLRERLHRIELGGAIGALSVEVAEPAPWSPPARDLFDRRRADEARASLLARLHDALGATALLRPHHVDRHRPERAWAGEDPAPPPRATQGPLEAALAEDPVQEQMGWPTERLPDRPPLLLDPPRTLELRRGEGGRPQVIHLDGRWQELRDVCGPERISGEWWEDAFAREYWTAHTDAGQRLWIYLEDGQCFLQGLWD
jgi:protein ImuB